MDSNVDQGSDGLYYRLQYRNVDWITAQTTCEKEEARLAIIRKRSTYNHIKVR